MKINAARLREQLESLGRIGADPQGQGVNRFSYSKEDEEGIAYVSRLMKDAGMTVEIDPIGNLIGTKTGRSDRILLLGSHIDSVPHAGIFDGCLGVLAAVEAVRTLQENGTELFHTIKVAAWIEEEGNVVTGLLGSNSFTGELCDLPEVNRQKLAKCGHSVEDMRASRCTYLDEIDASLELHIEQGGILDSDKVNIGVVNGIFGHHNHQVTIYGESNHAGSTPMRLRDDAMIKAAHLICELDDYARKIDPDMVYTTGWLNASPGANNIIPGEVTLMVECRGMDRDCLWAMRDYVKDRFAENEVRIEDTFLHQEIRFSKLCCDVIAESAEELGLSYQDIYSGAGHDSQALAQVIKNAGMIFVPSVGGKSHCPEEWTDWSDCENGANVLLQSVLKLDKKLQ